MKSVNYRRQLLGGVATSILGALSLAALSEQAAASSICIADTATSFSCSDPSVSPAASATGTFSAGAILTSSPSASLGITADGSLDVALSGQLNASASTQFGTTAVHLMASGTLSYVNSGTTSGSTTGWLFNTYLRSDELIVAQTGTVTADGYRVTGVWSETMNGDNTLIGGTTTVSGVWSRGLFSDAWHGNNRTDTGTVMATGYLSRGVLARALQNSRYQCEDDNGTLSTTINVTGDVSAHFVGVQALTCGGSTVNVGAGNTVSVTWDEGMAILNMATSSADTNIDGNVLAASIANLALDVRAAASATVIGGTGFMSGTFDGAEGADTITIAQGGTWTSGSTSDFREGVDSVHNAGTINAEAGTFANLELFANNGTLSLSGGSFTLTGSADFINNGTIEVVPGETVITSDSPLVNNGAIDLQNGQTGDILTIANDYVAGTTATLLMDVSESASDLFVVNGNSTGTTQLFFDAPESVNTNGRLIAIIDDPVGTLSISSTGRPVINFVLGNPAATRLINFQLEQVGSQLFLTAVPNETAFHPMLVSQVSRDLWHQSADIYSAYVALRRNDMNSKQRKPVSVWGQAYASRNDDGESSTHTLFGTEIETDNRLRTNRSGIQVGIQLALGESIAAGLTGGYGRANADFRGRAGGIDAVGWNVGAYGQVGEATGLYGNILVKYDRSDLKLTHSAFSLAQGRPDSMSIGGEAEVGYRWSSGSTRFELGSSLSYVKTSIDDFSAEGIDFDYDSTSSLRGSLDAGVVFGRSKIEPFLKSRLLREFDGDSMLTLMSGTEADSVEAEGSRTWVRLEAGIGGKGGSGPILAGWAELGDVEGFGVRAGWRF